PGFAHVGDPAVDDHARVEDLVAALRSGGTKQPGKPRRFEPLAVLGAKDQAEIWQDDQREAVKELDAAVAVVGPEQARDDGVGDSEADGALYELPEDAGDRRVAEPAFEQDDQAGQREREQDVGGNSDVNR